MNPDRKQIKEVEEAAADAAIAVFYAGGTKAEMEAAAEAAGWKAVDVFTADDMDRSDGMGA